LTNSIALRNFRVIDAAAGSMFVPHLSRTQLSCCRGSSTGLGHDGRIATQNTSVELTAVPTSGDARDRAGAMLKQRGRTCWEPSC
jgi:hypothetical protein